MNLPSRPRLRRSGTGPPDYVGVGTLWAGAPWWHNVLLKHPDVERPPRSQRSLGFFQAFCQREMTEADVADYHARFPRRPGKLAGEWSQRYMFDFWTPRLLHRAAPEARLLVLVADPIERYRKKLGTELRERAPEHATYYMAETVTRGRYASQLEDLWRYYAPERTLVLQYEACRLDPVAEYRRTLRFLGLRDDYEPFTSLRTRVGTAVRRALTRREPRTELWPDLETALRAELEDEVRELKRLVPELDLTLWPGFADLADPAEKAVAEAV